jgi:Zn finger protein HypA/HybF involved in hydrogenase expression
MFDTVQLEPGTEPNWLDGVQLPGPDEWGRDPFDPRCRCQRCGHDWQKRLPFGQWPNACPDCKSPRWYRPPKQKGRTPVVLLTTPEQMSEALDQAYGSLDWILKATLKQLAPEHHHPSLRCLRCKHKWHRRGARKRLPRACPHCRSPRWFVPRHDAKRA